MAIFKKSALGQVKGKLDNLVFYEVAGQQRIRSLPGSYKDNKSPKQLAHRAKVRAVASLYGAIDLQLDAYWKELVKGTTMSAYNLFFSRNIGNMTPEGGIADFSKVVVTQGDVEASEWWKAELKEPHLLEVQWDVHAQQANASWDYVQLAVLYDAPVPEKRKVRVEALYEAKRSDGRLVWRFGKERAGVRHVYAFFRARFENEVSESCYLGCF